MAHARVLDALEGELAALGLPVRREGTGPVNLVAGSGPGGIWLVAHSDSVRGAPGAADDGFGLGVALEAARTLRDVRDLHVLVTDGEEAGLLGAKAHVVAAGRTPRLVLNLEARGATGPVYMFQVSGAPGPLLDAWRAAGCTAQTSSLAAWVYRLLPNDTDFTVLRRANWTGYDFALLHDSWRYHTPDDVPEGLSAASVQQAGDCVVGLVRAWSGKATPTAGPVDRAWEQLPIGLFELPLPAVRAIAAFVLLVTHLRAGRPSPAGYLAWFLSFFGALTVGAGITLGLGSIGAWTRPAEMQHPHAWYAAVILGAILAGGGAWRLVGRWAGPAVGWHRLVATLSGLTGLLLPEVGYVLLPGGLAAAAAARGRPGLAAPAAWVAGVFVAPVLFAVPEALTSRMSVAIALLPIGLLAWAAPSAAPQLVEDRVDDTLPPRADPHR